MSNGQDLLKRSRELLQGRPDEAPPSPNAPSILQRSQSLLDSTKVDTALSVQPDLSYEQVGPQQLLTNPTLMYLLGEEAPQAILDADLDRYPISTDLIDRSLGLMGDIDLRAYGEEDRSLLGEWFQGFGRDTWEILKESKGYKLPWWILKGLGNMVEEPIDYAMATWLGLGTVSEEDLRELKIAGQTALGLGLAAAGALAAAPIAVAAAGAAGIGAAGAATAGLIGGLAGGAAVPATVFGLQSGRGARGVARELGRDMAFMTMLGLGAKVAAPVVGAGVRAGIQAGVNRVGRAGIDDAAAASLKGSVDDLAKVIEDPARTVDNTLDRRGYQIRDGTGGTFDVIDPRTNRTVQQGLNTADDVENFTRNAEELSIEFHYPNATQIPGRASVPADMTTIWDRFSSGIRGLHLRDVFFPQNFRGAVETFNSFLRTRIPELGVNAAKLVPAMQQINSLFLDLSAKLPAAHKARAAAYKAVRPFVKEIQDIYKGLTPVQRADKLMNISRYLSGRSRKEIGTIAGPAVRSLIGRYAPVLRAASSDRIDEVIRYARGMEHFRKQNPNAQMDALLEESIRLSAKYQWDDTVAGQLRALGDEIVEGRLNNVPLNYYNIRAYTDSIAGRTASRSTMAKRLGLTPADIKVASLHRAALKKLGISSETDSYIRHVAPARTAIGDRTGTELAALARQLAETKTLGVLEDMILNKNWYFSNNSIKQLLTYAGHKGWFEVVGNTWNRLNDAIESAATLGRINRTNNKSYQNTKAFMRESRGVGQPDVIAFAESLDAITSKLTKRIPWFKNQEALGTRLLNTLATLQSHNLLGMRVELGLRDIYDNLDAMWVMYGETAAADMFRRMTVEFGSNPKRVIAEMKDLRQRGFVTDISLSREARIAAQQIRPGAPAGILTGPLADAANVWLSIAEHATAQTPVLQLSQWAIFRHTQDLVRRELKNLLEHGDVDDFLTRTQINRSAPEFEARMANLAEKYAEQGGGAGIARSIADAAGQDRALTIVGIYGYGFGPISGGPLGRLMMPFRSWQAIRRQQLWNSATRGNWKQRAGSTIRMAASTAMWWGFMQNQGWTAQKYDPVAGSFAPYAGGPVVGAFEDLALASYQDREPTEAIRRSMTNLLLPRYVQKAYSADPWTAFIAR